MLIRVQVWRRQPKEFFQETARIEADGSLVPTTGECKQGMDMTHKGVWGYHPLLVSLANTGEPLFLANRSGNRPSHEGAPEVFDRAIELCRRAGFTDILLRGDTDFSLTKNFDRWDEDGVRFVFGYDAKPNLVGKAGKMAASAYSRLCRKADKAFESKLRRAKQPRVKEAIVKQRGYLNLVLEQEDLAEFDYRPTRARRTYRMIVLRKTILEESKQVCLGHHERYLFYITNDRALSPEQVVREANTRCNQDNLRLAAQQRRPRSSRAREHADGQLGLHGHRVPGLDPQGVVRPHAPHQRPMARSARGRTRTPAADGIPHLRPVPGAHSRAGRPHRPPLGPARARLAPQPPHAVPSPRRSRMSRACPTHWGPGRSASTETRLPQIEVRTPTSQTKRRPGEARGARAPAARDLLDTPSACRRVLD
jgi:hypothetical protein